jgi:hypothetical protein
MESVKSKEFLTGALLVKIEMQQIYFGHRFLLLNFLQICAICGKKIRTEHEFIPIYKVFLKINLCQSAQSVVLCIKHRWTQIFTDF